MSTDSQNRLLTERILDYGTLKETHSFVTHELALSLILRIYLSTFLLIYLTPFYVPQNEKTLINLNQKLKFSECYVAQSLFVWNSPSLSNKGKLPCCLYEYMRILRSCDYLFIYFNFAYFFLIFSLFTLAAVRQYTSNKGAALRT